MKHLLPLIALVLAACVPVDTYTDPALRQGYAEVEAEATDTQLDAAQRATEQADKVARMVATQTALAHNAEATALANDRIAAQSTRMSIETSQAYTATRAAVITQHYIDSAATLSAFNVTQRAGLYQSQQQEQRATLEAERIDSEHHARGFLIWGLVIGAVVGFFIIVLALSGLTLPKIIPPLIAALGENRSRWQVAIGIRDSLRGRDMTASLTNLPSQPGGVPEMEVRIVPGHAKPVVPGQPAPTPADFAHLHPDNRDAILVVQKMASIVGGHADQLPSAPKRIERGLYNEVAQPVINALKVRNDLESRDGAGVFVNALKWKDLDDLAQGLVDGRIDLRGQIEWKGDKRPALTWAAAIGTD